MLCLIMLVLCLHQYLLARDWEILARFSQKSLSLHRKTTPTLNVFVYRITHIINFGGLKTICFKTMKEAFSHWMIKKKLKILFQ